MGMLPLATSPQAVCMATSSQAVSMEMLPLATSSQAV